MIKTASTVNPAGKVWNHKRKTEIVQIFISHGDSINSFHFQYVENGSLVLSEWPGQIQPARNFSTIKLDYPEEFLTSVSGSLKSIKATYGRYDHSRVTSIAFDTNKGSYGPFGVVSSGGTKFNFEMGEDRQFGGFHGTTADGFLESIGVYVKPSTDLNLLGGGVETVPPVKVEPILRKA